MGACHLMALILALWYSICTSHQQPLREHVPTLSAEVEAVVLKALEKDPKQRFASVQELAAAFEEACKDIPVAENILSVPFIEDAENGSSELADLRLESLAGDLAALVQEKMPLDRIEGPEVAWPSHYSSLQAPSLSASLNMGMSAQDTANVTTAAQHNLVDVDALPPYHTIGRVFLEGR